MTLAGHERPAEVLTRMIDSTYIITHLIAYYPILAIRGLLS